MSPHNGFQEQVHKRFREAFGPPEITEGKDEQWTLAHIGGILPAKVLLNGTWESLTLWVFDPHAPAPTSVHSRTITETDNVETVIAHIREQLSKAPPSMMERARGATRSVEETPMNQPTRAKRAKKA